MKKEIDVKFRNTFCKQNATYNRNLIAYYKNKGYEIKDIDGKNGVITFIEKLV